MVAKKWWLINDEDVNTIKKALDDGIIPITKNMIALKKDAIHTLDSGLHRTDVIPDDYILMEVTE